MSAEVVIIGAGGHARVIADALRRSGAHVLGFTDADSQRHGLVLDGDCVLGSDEILKVYSTTQISLANGLGSVSAPEKRRAVQERLSSAGWRFIKVVHPRATVSPSASFCEGVQIMAGAIVQAGAVLGDGCIVNTGAIVDHDCVLGAYCHIAPGAVLSGHVTLGDCSHVGAGAVIIQGMQLGPNTVVGAGAVVIRNHPGATTLVGVPAKSKIKS